MSCIDLLGRTWAPPAPPSPPVTARRPPPQVTARQAAPPPPAASKLPDPPPLDNGPLTVDDAWAIFGIPQKRASRDEVKHRYLLFAAKWHPDKNPEDQVTATAQLSRANAAWALLQKHCRW